MKQIGFVHVLRDQVTGAPTSFSDGTNPSDMSFERFVTMLASPIDDAPSTVEPASDRDVVIELDPKMTEIGMEAIERGEVALVLVTGDHHDHTYLSQALADGTPLFTQRIISVSHPSLPVWIMTNPTNHVDVSRLCAAVSHPGAPMVTFEQTSLPQLCVDNTLWLEDGEPKHRSCGTGGLAAALVNHRLLDTNPAVKNVLVMDIDNLNGIPAPDVLGHHIAKGAPMTCEIATSSSMAYGLYHADGSLKLIKNSYVGGEDKSELESVGNFILSAELIKELDGVTWPYHRIRHHEDNKLFVGFERHIEHVTSLVNSEYVLVPSDRGAMR